MTCRRSAMVLGVLAFTCGMPLQAGQEGVASTKVDLTPEQMETFLLQAEIIGMRGAGNGVTNSRRATLTDGHLTHDAHVQIIDASRSLFEAGKASEVNFKDSYRFNIAAYRFARLLGLSVPVSVQRNVEGKPAAVTWWVDGVLIDEGKRVKKKISPPGPVRFSTQIQIMRIFDELIQNRDRNQGNILWTTDWTLWMIDHTRGFRLGRDLLKPDQLQRCERSLFAKLRGLTTDAVTDAVGNSLTRDEIAAVLARRDAIVRHFEKRIAERGEAAVLFDEPARAAAGRNETASFAASPSAGTSMRSRRSS